MKTTVRRFTPSRSLLLAGLAATGFVAAVAGPATAASASPATTPVSAVSADTPAAPAPVFAAAKGLEHSFQLQENGYYCAPSATRVALSAQGKALTQDQVAKELGTTVNGTDSINQVTGALNKQLGAGRYHSVGIPGAKASPAQVAQFKTDVMTALSAGKPVVANIAGTTTDDNGDRHSYEGGHYIPIVGYANGGATVIIADSADTAGSPYYPISADKVAQWIATRGYSA